MPHFCLVDALHYTWIFFCFSKTFVSLKMSCFSKILLNVFVRFMVFYDDGKAAYLALPDIHVVCKQGKRFSFKLRFSLSLRPHEIAWLLEVNFVNICFLCSEKGVEGHRGWGMSVAGEGISPCLSQPHCCGTSHRARHQGSAKWQVWVLHGASVGWQPDPDLL